MYAEFDILVNNVINNILTQWYLGNKLRIIFKI